VKYAMMAARTASLNDEAEVLDGKKRLGKNQKARRAAIADELSRMTQNQPAATVRKPAAQPDQYGGDYQGNVYENHRRNRFGMGSMGFRAMRRNPGRGRIQFKRSRIQRATRKQRTGGVR
jgi:hypothetical protein